MYDFNQTSYHDDVIKWRHFPCYWPFVRGIQRSPVNSPHKGQWRGALMFSLICVWINGWVNNREASDLRRYRAHYDVTVMVKCRTKYHFSTNCCEISEAKTVGNFIWMSLQLLRKFHLYSVPLFKLLLRRTVKRYITSPGTGQKSHLAGLSSRGPGNVESAVMRSYRHVILWLSGCPQCHGLYGSARGQQFSIYL